MFPLLNVLPKEIVIFIFSFAPEHRENINRRCTMRRNDGKPKRNVKHNIYENVNGEEVLVTEVSHDANYVSRFKDAVSLGEVKRWVRVVFW